MNSTLPWTTATWMTTEDELRNISTTANLSITSFDRSRNNDDTLFIILIPIVAVLCLLSAIGTIAWALRRNRMDKLRQHLMPMYSLEASDSGQEWEVDLLSQEVRHGSDSLTSYSSPCLKFNTMHSEL